jgi:exodeoxyribonuclease VII large subunit
VGVVTSLQGAALHDVATTLARRSPHIEVIVYPSAVQGVDAPAALCQAISTAGQRGEVDILIVCRGGGSLEDLWAFNDERVVRAIAAAPMPVLSGVGHETDVSLADLAADLRAPTPTAAAELAAPATAVHLQALEALASALSRRVRVVLETRAQRIDRAALRLARPSDELRGRVHRLDMLEQRLGAAPLRALDAALSRCATASHRIRHAVRLARSRWSSRLDVAAAGLKALDPDRVLARGYVRLEQGGGRPVTSVEQLAAGDRIRARFHDGGATLDVTHALSVTGECKLPTIACQNNRLPKERHGTHSAPAPVPHRCARAPRQQGDAGVPPWQAPQGLRRQPEQPPEGDRVRVDGSRGHRPQGVGRDLQQRGPDLEPHLLLELHEAGRRR